MVTSELGACEWFVWDLRRSNLLDRGRLDQIIGEYLSKNPNAEPPALAEYLIAQGILTDFQAERLLQGKTQGFVLGPFTLMDALGAGSMGTVYKAQSKTDQHWYAVKVLPRRSMWNVRIARRKVRAFEQCKHPAVVPFVDVGTAGGMHYLAWPMVQGNTLEKIIQEKSRSAPGIPHGLAAHYALQIAEGLDVCHTQGLIHGLLKPSNIMIEADHQVHILDFGIGCLLAETEGESLVDTMSTANSVANGLDCSSPESIMDPTNLTPQGDQYSLGCTLYYMLTGQYPFPDGSAAEKMMAHQFKQPGSIAELASDVPQELIDIVDRLLQKSPDGRFSNAGELVDQLRPLAEKPAAPGVKEPARPRNMPGAKKEAPPAPKKDSGFNAPPPPTPARQPSGAVPRPQNVSGSMQRPGTMMNPTAKPVARPATMSGHIVRPTTMNSVPAPAPSKNVAPSAPTPQPQALGSLPTRSSLRATAQMPVIKLQPVARHVPQVEDEVDLAMSPHQVQPAAISNPESEERPRRWEEKIGPLGLVMMTALVCCGIFAAARYFGWI